MLSKTKAAQSWSRWHNKSEDCLREPRFEAFSRLSKCVLCVCASLCNKYSKTQIPSNYFLTRGNRGGWYLQHAHCPRYPHFLAGNSEGFLRPLGHWSLLHADRRQAAHWWRHFLVGLQSHWCQSRSGMRTIDQCWRCTKIPFAAHMRGHICSTRSCSMSTAFRWHPWAAQVSLQARAPCRQGQPQPRPRRTRYGGPWRCNGALPSQLEKPKCSEWRFGYVSSKNWYPDVPRWTSKWLVNGAGALGVLGAVVLRSKDRTNEELPLDTTSTNDFGLFRLWDSRYHIENVIKWARQQAWQHWTILDPLTHSQKCPVSKCLWWYLDLCLLKHVETIEIKDLLASHPQSFKDPNSNISGPTVRGGSALLIRWPICWTSHGMRLASASTDQLKVVIETLCVIYAAAPKLNHVGQINVNEIKVLRQLKPRMFKNNT